MTVSPKLQIEQLSFQIINLINKVIVGKDTIEKVIDPLDAYFKTAGGGGIARVADENIQKLLKISLQARNFGNRFKIKGTNQWRDAGWLITNFTEGGVGRKTANQKGIMTLRDFKDTVSGVSQMTEAADSFADTLMVYLGLDVRNFASSLALANPMVCKEIKTINRATRADLARFRPNIDQAIYLLGKM
jgi:hypothetical protein